ncbi:hypothetical protein [Pseudosulfitobacter pseudonitzschiae]|uniref:hypothetical protein n=1 Tax=Pseudosulfitobacter pseudonitzschiae TaxID=1402135 RepID=UPI003B7CE3EF
MSSDALRKTRLHFEYASRREEVRFESSGSVERSFSILVIEKQKSADAPDLKPGIAVIDNDNLSVVLQGIDADRMENPILTMLRVAELQTMEWQDFSEYCRNHPSYRGAAPDIDQWSKLPHPGNLQNQRSIGLANDQLQDIRSDFLRSLDDDPDVPYSFPAIDRDSIEQEIASHLRFNERNGRRSHIAWDIRMNMNWNRTGRLRGGTDVNPVHDHDWARLINDESEIIEIACQRATQDYTNGMISILDMEEYPCEFRRIGKNNGFLIIESFAGIYLFATPDIDISERLIRLSDPQIEALWAIVRVMDFETSRIARTLEMEYQMHLLRVETEKNNWKIPA